MLGFRNQRLIFLFAAVLFLLPYESFCAKKKKNTEETQTAETIKLPSQKRTYFYKIDEKILSGVENGSPESLRQSMSLIKKSSSDYAENEKVLIYISTKIMQNVWKSQKFSWENVIPPEDNPYVGAIKSAENGVFDSSTGNVDFLSTLLPTFVLLNPNFKPSEEKQILESCEKSIKTALSLSPDSIIANYLAGIIYMDKEDYNTSLKYLEFAYEKYPGIDEIVLAYVKSLRGNGKYEMASAILAGSAKDANDIAFLKQNAYVAFESKDYANAELYVAKVLQQTPNDLEFLLFRAKILIEKNDYIHAVSLLDMYARQDNSSIDYLLLRAKLQMDWSKNTTAATETIEKALQLYPDNMDALLFAARISSVTDLPVAGKYADELSSIILKLSPSNASAMEYALDGLIQRENWKEAYEVSKNLISMENISFETMEKYVTVCIKLGKNNEAFEYAKKIHDANPNDETVLQMYILAYIKVGNRETVLKFIDSQLTSSNANMKSFLYYARSFLQYTENNTLADLRSSLISNPRNSDSLFRLYEIYYDKKDYRKAQYYLKQVVAINPNDSNVKKLNEALTKLIQ